MPEWYSNEVKGVHFMDRIMGNDCLVAVTRRYTGAALHVTNQTQQMHNNVSNTIKEVGEENVLV